MPRRFSVVAILVTPRGTRALRSGQHGPPPCGLSPCLLESYGGQAEGYGPAFRSVRAGRPQGDGPRLYLALYLPAQREN